MDEKELQAVAEAMDQLRQGGVASAESLKGLNTASKKFQDQLNSNLKALGSSMLGVAKAMKDGEQGASVYNDSINAAADAIDTFASKFGFLGKIIGTIITAGARYAAEVNKQSDALFKTYKDLSSSGLADAGGMRSIFDNMQKFGYGIEQLGTMTELLKENGRALANFGGTATTGTKAFADAASEIQRSDLGRSLQMLGKTPDDINKGIAGFIRQQQLAGVSATNIQRDLSAKSAEYVKQLDLMSKLTGESNEALQANREQAMAENAFNQTIYELRKQGDEASMKRADELLKASDLLKSAPALQKDFWMSVGNDASAMSKMMTGGMADAAVYTQNANFQAAEFVKRLKEGGQTFRDTQGGLFKINGALDDVAYTAKEYSALQAIGGDKAMQQNEDLAKAQQELQQKGLDPATKAQVEMRIEQMKTRDEFQSLINKGINPVTKGMAKLAGITETLADKLPGTETSTGTKMGGGESGGTGWWQRLFGSGGATGTTEQILETIKKRESGGNYNAQAKGSTASGAYQFIDSTWQSLTKKAGIGTEYKSAKLAPKEIQDAIAKTYVEDLLKQASGDVSKVPLAWYTGNIQGKISPEALAANKGLTPEMYQQKWMADYNKTGGATNVTGPSGNYQSQLASNPTSALPNKDQNQAAQNVNASNPSDEILQSFTTALQSLDRKMGDVADNTKKSAQYQAV